MSRRGTDEALDFEIQLAPIIDCFVVLITFMLASASFLSISIFDAGYTPVQAVGDPKPPPVTVTMTIKSGQRIVIEVDGKERSKQEKHSPAEAGEFLKGIKGRYPALDSVTLSAEDGIPYEELVKTMEVIRPVMPGIVLGGF